MGPPLNSGGDHALPAIQLLDVRASMGPPLNSGGDQGTGVDDKGSD